MAKLNVLVADDATFIRDLIRRGLTAAIPDVTVHEAYNGRQAQEILLKKPVDIILCDWEMPEVDGYEVISWMRADERFRKLPFIMVTSRGEKTHVVSAMRVGIDAYIVKPFTIDILMHKIQETLARYGRNLAEELKIPPSPVVSSDAVAILTGNYRKDRDKDAKKTNSPCNQLVKANAQLRYSGRVERCLVQKIDLHGAWVVIPRRDGCPVLMEHVVFALSLPAIQIKDINAVVNTVEPLEVRDNICFVRIVLRFVDEDPKKLETLSHIINALS